MARADRRARQGTPVLYVTLSLSGVLSPSCVLRWLLTSYFVYVRVLSGTNCGKRGTGGQFCDGCGNSLAHTPTAQERARAAAAAAAARSNVVVECPSCRIRCLVSTSARGTLQCPNGHLFQLRVPPQLGNSQQGGMGMRQSFSGSSSGMPGGVGGSRLIMRQCPTCYTRVQMPPGSQPGQYMCPHGHTFYFTPFQ